MISRKRAARLRSMRLVGQVPVVSPEPRPRVVEVPRRNTTYASQIDPQYPVYGTPTTQSVRDNFQAAKDEIETLQLAKLDLAGGTMTGPIVFVQDQIIDGGFFGT
jgi:hypothetical protein